MALPSPIPDNPTRWDGWRYYNSDNLYERLCLSFDSNPSDQQIEENCRQLLIWWQKKLPLKNQPSNPMAQLLRVGLDEAPQFLVEARTELLNAESRGKLDEYLRGQLKDHARSEFMKFLAFSLGDKTLTREKEMNLHQLGLNSGLTMEDMDAIIEDELVKVGAQRKADVEVPQAPVAVAPSGAPSVPIQGRSDDPFEEFRRMLKLSGLDSDLTDDQRDALCNMGENLGLTGGQAEDLIDEYIDMMDGMPVTPISSAGQKRTATPAPAIKKNDPAPPKKEVVTAKVTEESMVKAFAVKLSPLNRAEEKAKYPNFTNSLGIEMLLISSGSFDMGSNGREAAPNEKPVGQVLLQCYHISRFPITNWQYEQFDPTHVAKRMSGTDDRHPAVYVSSLDAEKFCQWLSSRDRKKYRLPTEAEWEYAARGTDGRIFPWGNVLDRGNLANFADRRTNFAWREPEIDDGYAETAPVGAYPRGVSPFGVEDMSGNIWEWCLDYFEAYKEKPRLNPRGPANGTKRMYRGGSWKSRANSLRVTARNFNLPAYSSNDVGFRIVCECA